MADVSYGTWVTLFHLEYSSGRRKADNSSAHSAEIKNERSHTSTRTCAFTLPFNIIVPFMPSFDNLAFSHIS